MGTATNGVNYAGTNTTITLASGQSFTNFNIPILNDGVADPAPAGFYFYVLLTNTVTTNVAVVDIVDAYSYNLPPGTLDSNFATNGMDGDVLALALQPDNQILAAGGFTDVGPQPSSRLARLNTDASLDTSFLNGVSGANATVYAMTVQTDGRVLVGGSFSTMDSVRRNFIARLMTDGSLDTSFNPGSGADNTVYAVAETFIGGVRRVYAGGSFALYTAAHVPGLVRLTADLTDQNNQGGVDSSFSVGSGFDGNIYGVAVYPTNSIYAGKLVVGG